MGTFSIKGATSVSQKTAPGTNTWGGGNIGADIARPTADANLLAGINSTAATNPSLYGGWVSTGPDPTGTWQIRFGFGLGDAVISLDGGAPISYFSLPAGIRILTATLKIDVQRYINASADPTPNLFLQRNSLTESGNVGQVNSLIAVTKTFTYDFSPVGFGTFLDTINDGFGIRVPFTTNGSVGQEFFNARIEGTYDILNYAYTMDPTGGDNVDVGDIVTITSPGTDPLTDLNLSELTISMACGTITPIVQTATLLTFAIPAACTGAGLVAVNAIGNGTQFSGTVPLGFLTILLTDASGIYTLTKGKTDDTLYSSLRDGTTREVKIPNPFIKTGYIGG